MEVEIEVESVEQEKVLNFITTAENQVAKPVLNFITNRASL